MGVAILTNILVKDYQEYYAKIMNVSPWNQTRKQFKNNLENNNSLLQVLLLQLDEKSTFFPTPVSLSSLEGFIFTQQPKDYTADSQLRRLLYSPPCHPHRLIKYSQVPRKDTTSTREDFRA